MAGIFSSCDTLTKFSTFYLFFCCVSLSNCHFCVNVSANHTIVEELSVTFDEKLAPLKVEIAELRYFIENANQKYDQVLEKLTEQEKACKGIKKENNFLKSTVNTCT